MFSEKIIIYTHQSYAQISTRYHFSYARASPRSQPSEQE